MTNLELIKQKLLDSGDGYIVGCYNPILERLNADQMNELLGWVDEYGIDVPVFIDGKKYVVEIETWGNGRDFHVLEVREYERKYGRKFEK